MVSKQNTQATISTVVSIEILYGMLKWKKTLFLDARPPKSELRNERSKYNFNNDLCNMLPKLSKHN